MGAEKERRALERARRAEAVRLLLRRELQHLPQRLLAPLVGINRNSLRKFLALSEPERATWQRLQEWARDRPEPDTPLGAVALAILASEFPAPHRLRARRHLARTLARLYVELDRQPPSWLVEELADAKEEPPGQAE
ncbi:MAG TPA: hypothetical protein VHG28_13270 [Longimicrobiaceae bacterium]|nr:hypothetical protein [Longimicrobiaceae bacterium]